MLQTERNVQPMPERAELHILNPNEGLSADLLESGLGFIAGTNPTQTLTASRLVNPQPHLQLSKEENKTPAGAPYRLGFRV